MIKNIVVILSIVLNVLFAGLFILNWLQNSYYNAGQAQAIAQVATYFDKNKCGELNLQDAQGRTMIIREKNCENQPTNSNNNH